MSQFICSEIQNNIISDYLNNYSLSNLSKKYNISTFLIRKLLVFNNINIRQLKKQLNEPEIINLYKSGYYIKQISKLYNVDPDVIKRILQENKIIIRKTFYRKHKINENYFDILDSEDKLYFLGFLYADGCVSKNGYNTCIALKNSDKDILQKFASFIYNDPNNIIIDKKSKIKPFNTYSYLNINSKYFNYRLKNLGCVPAKSLILTYPNIEQHQHFIRGYFDGDGSINVTNCLVTFTSTYSFCLSIKKIIEKYAQCSTHLCKYKNIYRLSIHGRNNVLKLLNWLYQDAVFYLERKRNKYLEILNKSSMYYTNEEISMMFQLRKLGLSYDKIAHKMGKSGSGIRKALIKSNILK